MINCYQYLDEMRARMLSIVTPRVAMKITQVMEMTMFLKVTKKIKKLLLTMVMRVKVMMMRRIEVMLN